MTHDLGLPRPDSRLLETDSGTPPAEPTPVSRQGLPEDLLQEAAHRLGIVCLVSAGLWAANFLVVHLVHPLPGALEAMQLARHGEWRKVFDLVGGAAFAVSLALFWYTRHSRKSPRFLLDLALGYECSSRSPSGCSTTRSERPRACRGSPSSSSSFLRSYPAPHEGR